MPHTVHMTAAPGYDLGDPNSRVAAANKLREARRILEAPQAESLTRAMALVTSYRLAGEPVLVGSHTDEYLAQDAAEVLDSGGITAEVDRPITPEAAFAQAEERPQEPPQDVAARLGIVSGELREVKVTPIKAGVWSPSAKSSSLAMVLLAHAGGNPLMAASYGRALRTHTGDTGTYNDAIYALCHAFQPWLRPMVDEQGLLND